jgi:hypothetical protein
MQFDPLLNPIPVVDRQTRALGMAMGSCLAIRRALWNAAGGLPGFFGSIAEDMYLCWHHRNPESANFSSRFVLSIGSRGLPCGTAFRG